MPRKVYHNRAPQGLPPGAPRDATLVEFARRLQKLMVEKDWNQSDLARAAAKFMPNKKFRRDNISLYIRAVTFPSPQRLYALARALGVHADDLKPSGLAGADDKAVPLEFKDLGGGMVWLRVNQAVPFAEAMQIMGILGQQKKETP